MCKLLNRTLLSIGPCVLQIQMVVACDGRVTLKVWDWGGSVGMDETQEASPALKVFALLEAIAGMEHAPTLADLGEATSLPKPTLHRWMTMLEAANLVRRMPDGRRYELAARATKMAFSILSNNPGSTERHQILEQLVQNLHETCNLTILQGTKVVYLDRVEAKSPLRVAFQQGSRVPIHCSASGKMFLALMPVAKRKRLMDTLTFDAMTPNTLISRKRFDAELATIRKERYAFDDEEFLSGLFCVAVPIFGIRKSICVAGLALQAPVVRLNRDNALTRLAALRAAADLIAKTLA